MTVGEVRRGDGGLAGGIGTHPVAATWATRAAVEVVHDRVTDVPVSAAARHRADAPTRPYGRATSLTLGTGPARPHRAGAAERRPVVGRAGTRAVPPPGAGAHPRSPGWAHHRGHDRCRHAARDRAAAALVPAGGRRGPGCPAAQRHAHHMPVQGGGQVLASVGRRPPRGGRRLVLSGPGGGLPASRRAGLVLLQGAGHLAGRGRRADRSPARPVPPGRRTPLVPACGHPLRR